MNSLGYFKVGLAGKNKKRHNNAEQKNADLFHNIHFEIIEEEVKDIKQVIAI
jgi:hypothetical protein